MYYFEPININQWNMFEKVKKTGHVETFLAVKAMECGDIVLLHVGAQNNKFESGVYAFGTVVKEPYILKNSPKDYCNNRLTVDVRIDSINYSIPYITHLKCKQFLNQYRSVHQIKSEYYPLIIKSLE